MVQRSVESTPGVLKAEVNFGAQKLRVTHDIEIAPVQKIIQFLAQSGHPATIEALGQSSPNNVSWWRQPRMGTTRNSGITNTRDDSVHRGIPF